MLDEAERIVFFDLFDWSAWSIMIEFQAFLLNAPTPTNSDIHNPYCLWGKVSDCAR